MSNAEHEAFKKRIMERPLTIKWLSFLSQFKPSTEDCPEDRQAWKNLSKSILKTMEQSPDFAYFKKISYKAFDLCIYFINYPKELTCQTGDKNHLTPYGLAIYELHGILQDHLKDRQRAHYLTLKAGRGRAGIRMIAGYRQEPIKWADCGCCWESGGEESVALSDGTVLQFDENGVLVTLDGVWRRV